MRFTQLARDRKRDFQRIRLEEPLTPRNSTIGAYRLKGPLEASPHSSSFLAVERGSGRQSRWVLKYLPLTGGTPLAPAFREDFLDLLSMSHSALAFPTALGCDAERDRSYLVRPYVEGWDILSALRGRSARELIPWLLGAAEALSLLHRFGYLHRNVKPTNLLVPRAALRSSHATGPKIQLSDPAWWPEKDSLDGPGTPSPGDSETAPQGDDLYALGAVFYQLVSGRAVRCGDDGFPLPPGQVGTEVPVDLERMILKLLHPERSRRYRDATAVIEDLCLLGEVRHVSRLAAPDCFLDRSEEMGRVHTRLKEPARGAALVITGEAGVGKSTFLRRLALDAQFLGYRTIAVCCYSPESPPLAPVRSILEQLIPAGHAGRALRSRCRRLLKHDRPGHSASSTETARRALVRELVDLVGVAVAQVPTLLLLDEVHQADSLTVDFLAGLVRDVARHARSEPTAVGGAGRPHVAVCYRSESPFRAALQPLLEALGSPEAGHLLLELGPLSTATVERWLSLALPDAPRAKAEILRNAACGGHPFAIREAVRIGGSRLLEPPHLSKDLPSMHLDYLRSLGTREGSLLEALAILGRPAAPELLAAVLGCPPARLRSALESLLRDGTLREESGLFFFQHGSFHAWLVNSLGDEKAQALHRRVAGVLGKQKGGSSEEIAEHWLRSNRPKAGINAALKAARHLAGSHEDKRALHFYRALLELLGGPGTRDERLWRRVSEEAAEAYARTGEYRRSAEILQGLLGEELSGMETGRLHGRLGRNFHRAGDVGLASLHLERALSALAEAPGIEWVRERLQNESELAEIAVNQGDYAKAEAICRRALERLAACKKRAGDLEIRREELVLVETLAHLKLRRFEYPEARELFERSLKIGEEVNAVAEMSLILNNLGTLHIQESHFRQAIRCYQRAAKLSAKMGDAQSLTIIHSNLAALHAKLGDADSADEALETAAEQESRCDSLRARFVRLHNAGMVDLSLGRYASAVETFKAAVALGEELKDCFLVAFDLVYLGECHLYRGETKSALAAFERTLGLGAQLPAPVTAMVEARRAILASLRGDGQEARRAWEACANSSSGMIPYPEAWNHTFLGWSRRLLGERDGARSDLERARVFFRRAKVPAGEIQAELELALLDAESGNLVSADRRLRSLRSRYICGRGPLRNPMLSARLLAYQTQILLDRKPTDRSEAASLLVEAESYLIGRHLRDLEGIVRALRRRIRLATPATPAGSPLPPDPTTASSPGFDLLEGVGSAARDLLSVVRSEIGEDRTRAIQRHFRRFEETVQEAHRLVEGGEPPKSPPFRTSSIVGTSAAIREVKTCIRQCAPASLPVLITGETGTGKELVARSIHGESTRPLAPFQTVNCAALPAELLEAELFGYLRGAFSGAEKDRRGLLASADGGTFLFDNIAETPLSLQGKLLRVLDRRAVRPLGGTEEVQIDVRYLFSTSKNLPSEVEEGRFRRDLYYRLSTFAIQVPPLRERLEDLPLLVHHFRAQAREEREPPVVDEAALRVLAAHPWPGNVRELENVITRLVLTSSDRINAEEVRRVLGQAPPEGLFPPSFLRSRPLPDLQLQLEREYLLQLHADHGGDLKAIAARLGITQRALYDRFRKVGIRARELK